MSEYQTINEIIDVVGSFRAGARHFEPRRFRWRGRTHPITSITLTSDVKDGGVRKRLYSVVSNTAVFRLEFNRDTEQWLLAELWVE